MTTYPGADRTTQWFQDAYPGSKMSPNVVVLHTTEGTSWPGYGGGASAPNLTIRPLIDKKAFEIREHFSLDRSSRALRNLSGGVETNTLNAIQLELIGTCDPAHADTWGSKRAGVDYIFWPAAPDWALRELGRVLATLQKIHPEIPLSAPNLWNPYPKSYGSRGGQRFSGSTWRAFRGICGHQHVPENTHGDPGNLPIGKILAYALGTPPKPAAPKTPTMLDLTEALDEIRAASSNRRAQVSYALARRILGSLVTSDDRVRTPETVRDVVDVLTAKHDALGRGVTRTRLAAAIKLLKPLA